MVDVKVRACFFGPKEWMVCQARYIWTKSSQFSQATQDKIFTLVFQVNIVWKGNFLLKYHRQIKLAPYLERNSPDQQLIG